MNFSKVNPNILVVTENSVNPVCLRILANVENEKMNEEKSQDFGKFNWFYLINLRIIQMKFIVSKVSLSRFNSYRNCKPN